jgi:ATP-dependent RNA helicase DDX52/ROK1
MSINLPEEKIQAPLKLPSAGTSSNPQLYHDAIPESRGKKRKRRAEQNEENAPGDKDETIDFFATKVAAPKSKTPRSADQSRKLRNSSRKQSC